MVGRIVARLARGGDPSHTGHRRRGCAYAALVLAMALAASPAPARADGGWSSPTQLSGPDAADAPDVAAGGSGDAVAAWFEQVGGFSRIEARTYAPASGWAEAVAVDDGRGDAVSGVAVAMDRRGDAFAAWSQMDAAEYHVWGTPYVAGEGWGPPVQSPSCEPGGALNADVALDGDGDAFVVWSVYAAGGAAACGNRFVPASGWETPVRLGSRDGASRVRVAANEAGDAVSVWEDGFRIRAARYARAGGWQASDRIDDPAAGMADFPAVAVDAAGNAVAVWVQGTAMDRASVWASRSAGGVWDAPVGIDGGSTGSAGSPAVAVDADGDAAAVWGSLIPGVGTGLRANRFAPASGWGTPVSVWRAGTPQVPDVGMDASGRATAAWASDDDAMAHAAQADACGDWGAVALLPEGPSASIFASVAVDAGGNATAVWTQVSGASSRIWSARLPAGGSLGCRGSELTAPGLAFIGVATTAAVAAVTVGLRRRGKDAGPRDEGKP